jgi:hypothetical protein
MEFTAVHNFNFDILSVDILDFGHNLVPLIKNEDIPT